VIINYLPPTHNLSMMEILSNLCCCISGCICADTQSCTVWS